MSNFLKQTKSIFNAIVTVLKKCWTVVSNSLKVVSDWIINNILKKWNFIIFFAIFTITSLVLRICVFNFQSPDYLQFLHGWCEQISYNGGFSNFGAIVGYDYTMPYLYILTSISYLSPEYWVYGIKAVSILFDFILAIFVGLICEKITKNKVVFLVSYALTLLLPNVFLNSAIWGQCDVMFSSFIVMAIYFFICGKNRIAMLAYGVSFCLKIQAIFFLPVILLLMANKKVNLFYVIYSFLAILILNIPAFCMGIGFNRAIIEPILTQTSEYKSLSCNAVNLYLLIDKMAHYGMYEDEPNYFYKEWFASAILAFAIGVVVLAFVIIYRKKGKITPKRLVLISYFFAMLVPYVLPHMHERYWFLSDALAVLFIFCYYKHFYIAFLSCYPSFRICLNYLFDTGGGGDLNRIVLVLMMLLAIILTFKLLYAELNGDGEEIPLIENSLSKPQTYIVTNNNYVVTDLSSGAVVKSKVETEVAIVEEESLEEFLAEQEETEAEKSLEKLFLKVLNKEQNNNKNNG